MLNRVFRWFETRIDPYPRDEPTQPPQGLVAFCLHYSQGAKKWLVLMACLSAIVAAGEIALFGFLGNLVDWLGSADKATFLATEGPKLWGMAGLLVVLLILVTINSLNMHQALLANFPQRIRWMTHRYLLRQSMGYFQDEFAGRIATKLMQTSLAVREVMMKLLDVLVFVSVYFFGAVILAASSDWRLAVPFLVWLFCYVAMLWYFIPRLGKVGEAQAEARSSMTGRIVDSYTNIATVKLFSHSSREESYAHDAMDRFLGTAHSQMRMFSILNFGLYALNVALLGSLCATGIWLWLDGQVTGGVLAVSAALAMRFQGMSQWIMWEMTQLFENIGTVRDGISSISMPRVVKDAPGAKAIVVDKGDIRFENVSFHYGKSAGVIEDLNLHIRPGEKIGLVGRSGAGKSTVVNLLLRFYDRESGRIAIDGTDIATVTQDSASRAHRRRDAGYLAPPSLGAGQHPLWPSRRQRAGDAARRPPRGGARLRPGARRSRRSHRVRGSRRRARREAERWSAPAHRHRARAPQERADPRPRRGDLSARLRGRGGDPGSAAASDAQQDGDRDCAPPLDHRRDGPAGGARRRPHRRAGLAFGAHHARRPLRKTLDPPVRRVPRTRHRR